MSLPEKVVAWVQEEFAVAAQDAQYIAELLIAESHEELSEALAPLAEGLSPEEAQYTLQQAKQDCAQLIGEYTQKFVKPATTSESETTPESETAQPIEAKPSKKVRRGLVVVRKRASEAEKELLGEVPPEVPLSHGMGIQQALVLRQLVLSIVDNPFDRLIPKSGGVKLNEHRSEFLTLLCREGVCSVCDALVLTDGGNVRWGKKVLPGHKAKEVYQDYVIQHPKLNLEPV